MNPSNAGAAGKFVDGDRPAIARTIEVGPPHIERFAPGISALHDPSRGGFNRPCAGFGPFGIGAQAFSDPPRICPRFVPAYADDRKMLLAVVVLAVGPETRAGRAGLVHEVKEGRQSLFVPELELLVTASMDEPQVVGIRDAESIQIN